MVAQPLSATKAGGLDDALPDFVEIPAGPFVMGADPARDPLAFDNERWSPAAGEGTVDVPAFYIARHEVTVAQFAAFAARHDLDSPIRRRSPAPPTHPVTFVSWPDALAYCRWLEDDARSAHRRRRRVCSALVRDGWRVSLPTEAEWEKAARGTGSTPLSVGQRAAACTGELREHGHDAGRAIRVSRVSVWAVRHERQRVGVDAAARINRTRTTRPTTAKTSTPTRSG